MFVSHVVWIQKIFTLRAVFNLHAKAMVDIRRAKTNESCVRMFDEKNTHIKLYTRTRPDEFSGPRTKQIIFVFLISNGFFFSFCYLSK